MATLEETHTKPDKNMRMPAAKTSAQVLLPRLVLIITTLALILFGLVMVFSASSVEAINNNDSPFSYLQKQAFYAVVGLVGGVIIWKCIPFSVWKSNAIWVIFGFLFLAMLATLVMGTDIYGARRWLYFGPISLQPSEFAKIILIMLVAKMYIEWQTAVISTKKFFIITISTVVITIGFIYKAQSDLGTTAICCVGLLSVLWFGGAPKKLVLGLVIVLVGLVVLGTVTSEYRLQRFAYFLDPYNDGQGGYGKGYQLIRSRYALSEGGLFGVGLGNSYEKYQYLPEAETDFIFAIIGEELGMVGALLVVFLFMVFLVAGLYVSKYAGSAFGRMTSAAFVIMIVFQAFLNIFCVVGLFPTTGKPLPFISSGGSSLMVCIAMVGFVLSASEEPREMDEFQRRRQNFKVMGGFLDESEDKASSYTGRGVPSGGAVSSGVITGASSSYDGTKGKGSSKSRISIPSFLSDMRKPKQSTYKSTPDFSTAKKKRKSRNATQAMFAAKEEVSKIGSAFVNESQNVGADDKGVTAGRRQSSGKNGYDFRSRARNRNGGMNGNTANNNSVRYTAGRDSERGSGRGLRSEQKKTEGRYKNQPYPHSAGARKQQRSAGQAGNLAGRRGDSRRYQDRNGNQSSDRRSNSRGSNTSNKRGTKRGTNRRRNS